ncbi:MAG: hypothetical protein ACFFGZ_18495, partial [Candidatus Thorarchaeota archaeon]
HDMNVEYRYYAPNQGLEEQQAKIFNKAAKPPAQATGKAIQERYEQENVDPKTIRYAMTANGTMLAYCQARDYPALGETHIGYPWALPKCPPEVQEKLFDDLLAYLKEREETLTIRTSAALDWETQIAFFKKRGLVEIEHGFQYLVDLDVTEASQLEKDTVDNSFTSYIATDADLDVLLEIINADPVAKSIFPDDETWIRYFRERVLPDGHAVILFHEDQIVAASAPLRVPPGKEEHIIFRFQATRPGYASAWKALLIEIAKECLAAGWTDLPLRVNFGFFSNSPLAQLLARLQPDLEVSSIRFGLE